MKRLLAAGSGDIYQICHVARGYEASRLHNCEFTLVEWYRLGFGLPQLMDEVQALVRELCAAHPAVRAAPNGSRIARSSNAMWAWIPCRPRLPAAASGDPAPGLPGSGRNAT